MSSEAGNGISSWRGRQLLRKLREAATIPTFERCPECGGALHFTPRRDGPFLMPGPPAGTCTVCAWVAP